MAPVKAHPLTVGLYILSVVYIGHTLIDILFGAYPNALVVRAAKQGLG